jgi:hypothetical protein
MKIIVLYNYFILFQYVSCVVTYFSQITAGSVDVITFRLLPLKFTHHVFLIR